MMRSDAVIMLNISNLLFPERKSNDILHILKNLGMSGPFIHPPRNNPTGH